MDVSTHTVIVGAHIIQESRILLVLRRNEPQVWAPPGGHLNLSEEPLVGLRRELIEELNLIVAPICLTTYWYGLHMGRKVLALCFLCKIVGGNLEKILKK